MKRRQFQPLAIVPLLARKGREVKRYVGNYGMQTLEMDRALASIREIGYDGTKTWRQGIGVMGPEISGVSFWWNAEKLYRPRGPGDRPVFP